MFAELQLWLGLMLFFLVMAEFIFLIYVIYDFIKEKNYWGAIALSIFIIISGILLYELFLLLSL